MAEEQLKIEKKEEQSDRKCCKEHWAQIYAFEMIFQQTNMLLHILLVSALPKLSLEELMKLAKKSCSKKGFKELKHLCKKLYPAEYAQMQEKGII